MTPHDHSIRVTYHGRYPHGADQAGVDILCRGDGDTEHWLQTFRAAMVAAGYSVDTAHRLQLLPAVDPRRALADIRQTLED